MWRCVPNKYFFTPPPLRPPHLPPLKGGGEVGGRQRSLWLLLEAKPVIEEPKVDSRLGEAPEPYKTNALFDSLANLDELSEALGLRTALGRNFRI